MNRINIVQEIERDFEEQRKPFDNVEFPEARLLNEVADSLHEEETVSLSMEDKLRLVSAFATFDYNRDANQLVDNLLELQERAPKKFDAWNVDGAKEIQYLFEDIGFRYPNRDGKAWAKNCRILRNNYHGRWADLLLSTGCDAPALVERLSDDDFNCLKGVKIAPMYARIIDEFVAPLSATWDLEIPVDTHIRRLSKDLFDAPDADDDYIRAEWRVLAVEADISRQVVDGGLWHIGNKWDEWGEDYWESLK